MDTPLADLELRVLGCLIEKSATTPDAYPLTLNSLTTACNQKSARDPVMNLNDATVETTLDSLKQRGLVSTRSGAGNSRVTKYSHRMGKQDQLFENGYGDDELALLCVLFLRGPQTLNELKSRTNRLFAFQDVDQVNATLNRLKNRSDGPAVTLLAKAAGQKEARYAHLFASDEISSEPAGDIASPDKRPVEPVATQPAPAGAAPVAPATSAQSDRERISTLEKQVAELTDTVNRLKEALGES